MFKNSLLFLMLALSLLVSGCEKDDHDEKEAQETDMGMSEAGAEAGAEAGSEAGETNSDQDVSGGEDQLDCEPEFQGEDGCDEPQPAVDPACEPCEGEECPEDCDDNVEPQAGEESSEE